MIYILYLLLFLSFSILDKAVTEDNIAEKWKEDIFLVTQSTNPGVYPIFRLPVG